MRISAAALPEVPAGRRSVDAFGGTNGFLVTKDAPPEAVDFLKYYNSLEVQRERRSTASTSR